MPTISNSGSCRRRSSTPQVKAPCEPPPCKARETRRRLFVVCCMPPFGGNAVSPAFRPRRADSVRNGWRLAELQMKRLRAGERLEPEARERAAASGILDAGPGERRIEVIAAVHEPGARFDAIADGKRGVAIGRPYGRRKAVAAVVHQLDCLLVALDRQDACHRSEDFLGHH